MLRPANLILLALIQYTVYYCVILQNYPPDIPMPMPLSDITLLVAMTLCAAGGGYILNDFYDVGADAVNNPGKNAIGQRVSEHSAWITYALVSVLGALCAYYVTLRTGKNVLILYGVVMLALWSYSAYFQRLPLAGNVLVAAVCAVAVFLPWYVQPDSIKLEVWDKGLVVVFYALFAFLVTLIREIVKDVEDIEGDKHVESHTIPILFGETVARVLALSLVVITCGVFAFWMKVQGMQFPLLSKLWFALLVFLPLLYIGWAIYRARTRRAYRHISQYLKFLILSGTIYLILI